MREKNKERKIKFHNIVFIYFITTIIVTVISFSKYVSTVSTDKTAKIAVFANNVSVDIEFIKDAYPGTENIYPIEITNFEGDKICDVAQKFVIKINREEAENIAVIYGLYKDEYCTEIIEKDENGNYISEDFYFNSNEKETKTYYLKVVWPEEVSEEYLAFEMGYFAVNVVSTQID